MLEKMNLSYFKGNLYKKEPFHEPFHEPLREPLMPQGPTKEEYIAIMKNKAIEKRRWQMEQMEKRRLLISATDGSFVKINSPANTFFQLKTKF